MQSATNRPIRNSDLAVRDVRLPTEIRPTRRPRLARYATPAALVILVLTALAVTYVVAVVPARLAFLLSVWIGSMGLLIALPFLTVLAVSALGTRRHGEREPITEPGFTGRRAT